jgi:hypothetical protein
MPELDVAESLRVPFRFERRPLPLPPDMRPWWRVVVLTLILEKCHGSRADIEQLHVLNEALRSREGSSAFLRALSGDQDANDPLVRYDVSLTRAIDLAVGLGLAEWRHGARLHLSTRGREFVTSIESHEGLFRDVKSVLREIPGKVSSALIARMLGRRT